MELPENQARSSAPAVILRERRVMSRFSLALLAHSDAPTREAVSAQIERSGVTVQAAGDGLQALEIARLSPPQLALIGAQLEGMQPLDLCRALSNKGIPVLFLGGDGIPRDEALRAGAVDFLALPSFLEDVGAVGRLLAMRQREPGGDWIVR